MKLIRKSIPALIVLAVILAVTGCSGLLGMLFPMTIEDRINLFMAAINDENRTPTAILLNFGPESDMVYYDAAQADTFWEDAFPAENTYGFAITDETVTSAVEVAGTISTPSGGTIFTTYTFEMYQEESGNWLIKSIYEDPAGSNTMLIRKIDL